MSLQELINFSTGLSKSKGGLNMADIKPYLQQHGVWKTGMTRVQAEYMVGTLLQEQSELPMYPPSWSQKQIDDDLANELPMYPPSWTQKQIEADMAMYPHGWTADPVPVTVKPANGWGNIPGAIYFYDKADPYFEFTNLYRVPILIDGKVWKSSEHYFQNEKFKGYPAARKALAKTSGGYDTFSVAQEYKKYADPDWQSRSLNVLHRAVKEKFKQHPDLMQMLLGTGNATLVEDAGPNDEFYGAGAHMQGENKLGLTLMRVREELRA